MVVLFHVAVHVGVFPIEWFVFVQVVKTAAIRRIHRILSKMQLDHLFVGFGEDIRLTWIELALHAFDDVVAVIGHHLAF